MIATRTYLSTLMLAAASLLTTSMHAQVLAKATPAVRVTVKIDAAKRTTLQGHVPSALRSAVDLGRVDANTALPHMLMLLQSSSEQEHTLRTLIDQQKDSSTANFHKWLTPDQFEQQFGVSESDLDTVKGWLQQQGFSVEKVMKGGRVVEFSGTVGGFEQAFQTEFHKYQVAGKQHISINSEISVPSALAPVIRGVPTVHNFFKTPASIGQTTKGTMTRTPEGILQPDLTNGSTHYVTAGDAAIIYNSKPLISSGINGAGTTIGIVGRSDIGLNDVQIYREISGLAQNDPSFIVVGEDPGVVPGDDGESDLDVEIAGGAAPAAKVDFVVSKGTLTVDGITLSAMYLVENNIADIISESYGECEADLGTAGNALNSALWQQAAAQGISVFVSSDDTGPAGCDGQSSNNGSIYLALDGYAVSGDASTPYNVAVGGTTLSETSGLTYWNTSNAAGFISAVGYIPEVPWNQSASNSGISSGGGGISAYYATPAWQRGFGVPTTDPAYVGTGAFSTPSSPVIPGPHRYLPDVALNASSAHDATLYCSEGGCYINSSGGIGFSAVGGTSVAAPTMAGLQALINQANGGRQGLPNYQYYGVAQANHAAGLACTSSAPPAAGCAFHDSTTGNTLICADASCSTAGKIGWTASAGFDLASGLGSPNVYQLSTQWPSITFASTVTTLAIPTVGATHGTPSTLNVTVAPGSGTGTATGTVAFLTSSGAITDPIDESIGDFTNQAAICNLSGGICTIQLSALPAGQYNVIARYSGDASYGSSTSAPVAVNVASESSVLSLATNTLNCSAGTINPATTFAYGSPIFLDANVSGASGQGVATGKISITDNGNPLTTQSLNATGDAELISGILSSSCVYGYSINNISPLSIGTHSLGASYAGDGNFAATTLSPPLSVTVTQATLTTALNAPTTEVASGGSFNLFLTLTPLDASVQAAAPTGTVTFTDTTTSTVLGTTSIAVGKYGATTYGLASLTSTGLTTTGAHSITAVYSGDPNYASTTSSAVTVTVGGIAITSITTTSTSLTPTLGASNTLTSTLAPTTATGTITFYDGSTVLGTSTISSGKATLSSRALLGAGTHTITSVYNGSATYSSKTSPAITLTIAKGALTMILSAQTNTIPGANVTLTDRITAGNTAYIIPTGTVQFMDGATALGSPVPITTQISALGGLGIYELVGTYTSLTAGNHAITGVYSNDANYANVTSNIQTVKVYTKPVGNLELAIGASSGSSSVPQTDTLFVSGWAGDAVDGSESNVKVYIDGALQAVPTTGVSRPDVASSTGNSAYGTSGFHLYVAASGLSIGSHTASAVVTDTYGLTTTLNTLSFTVTPVYSAPVGNLEQAIDATTFATTVQQPDQLFVSGWAGDPQDGSPLTNVKVLIDGTSVGTPTLNVARPDVAAYPNSGYTFYYNTSTLTPGSHSVTVTAVDSKGLSTTFGPLTITVLAPAPPPPVGSLDQAIGATSFSSTVSQSEQLYVNGWAASPQTSGSITQVQVLLDGTAIGTATLGQSRPDVTAYPNSGWSAYFSAATIAQGTHTITTIATDSTGLTTTLGSKTITVTP